MKILYVCTYADAQTISELNKESTDEGILSEAAIKYAKLIGEGLKVKLGDDVTYLFLVPIGMYPVCKKLLFHKKKTDGNYYIPFFNLLVVKQLSICFFVFFFSVRWYLQKKKDEKKVIVFSFLYLPFLTAVAPLKIFKSFYIASFVPDMPEFEYSYSKTKFSFKRFLTPIYIFFIKKIVNVNDYFVYITKFMIDSFAKRPYLIIEGFVDLKTENQIDKCQSVKKAVMYSGALYEKFGIKMLMEAFHEIQGDYELWLFGNGDMEGDIISCVNKDSRIKYFGSIPNIEILKYQKKAKLLVNPRFTNNEFTKYSFPSKLMEYMMSGTPVLTTRLSGIPIDYNDKMYYIQEESITGMKNAMIFCLEKTQEELYEFATITKEYVFHEKNNSKQIEKFIDLISS
jgi:glycosyltransferase involved in cell wall biosynthesis